MFMWSSKASSAERSHRREFGTRAANWGVIRRGSLTDCLFISRSIYSGLFIVSLVGVHPETVICNRSNVHQWVTECVRTLSLNFCRCPGTGQVRRGRQYLRWVLVRGCLQGAWCRGAPLEGCLQDLSIRLRHHNLTLNRGPKEWVPRRWKLSFNLSFFVKSNQFSKQRKSIQSSHFRKNCSLYNNSQLDLSWILLHLLN